MKQKFLAFFTAITLVVLAIPTTILAWENPFSDVSENDWFYDDLVKVYELGLMKGRTAKDFVATGNVSVSEAITVISRMACTISKNNYEFSEDHEVWYKPYLDYAINNQLIADGEYDNFQRSITRYEVAQLVCRLQNESFVTINNVQEIPDITADNPYYVRIKNLYDAGILTGKDVYGSFYPENSITRAELAAIVNRILNPECRIKFELEITEKARHEAFLKAVEEFSSIKGEVTTLQNGNFEVSKNLIEKLNSSISKVGSNNCAFYAVTLDGKFAIGYNVDNPFASACTVKAPYTLHVHKEMEKGNGALTDLLEYTKKDVYGGSGVIQYEKIGTKFTTETVIYHTLTVSDNVGYYMLQDRYPIKGYNEFLDSINCSKLKLTGGIRWGYNYPREYAKVYNEIYSYSQTSEYGKQLYNVMANAKYNYIKQALETKNGALSYEVAHKSGWNDKVRNDCALVMGATPYVLVVCTNNTGKNKEAFNEIVILCNEAIVEYSSYEQQK